MRVLTWNIDQFAGHREPQLRLIRGLNPDVVMLQEVKGWLVGRLHGWWDGPVVAGSDFHPNAKPSWITSVLLLPPATVLRAAGSLDGLPRPQRGVFADADIPGFGDVHLVSWHNENAVADQPRKMAAFRAATAHLRNAPRPVVLGADLNTWTDPDRLVPADPAHAFYDEHAFVGPDPAHGLVDGWRTLRTASVGLFGSEDGPLAVSYRLRSGTPHRFDRILLSSDLEVCDGGYDYGAGIAAGSDHGVHWLDIRRRTT
jgi:endonuclease/exonuclease/phosphatase family metal-dependent hydrolase